MKVRNRAARDRPYASQVELFDRLMTISFLTKALANKVLCLRKDKFITQGGESHEEEK
jgi:hypothetical protein